MQRLTWLKFLFVTCLLVGSCAPRTQLDPLSVAPGAVETDPEFEEAISQAQTSLDTFRQGLLSPSPTQKFSGLRVRFQGPNEDAPEFHWTTVVDYFNGLFTAELLDSVSVDIGMHTGHQVVVPVEDVVDWIIVEEDGTFKGGYTVLLAYRRMSPEERKQFLKVTGYVIR